MEDVFVLGATRTAVGEFGGGLKDISACSLAMLIMQSVVSRAGIEKSDVEQVFIGNCFEPLDSNVSRIASVKAGMPIKAPAITISATCGSAMQATIAGIHSIREGDADVVLVGGVESMSTAPYLLTTSRWGQRLQHGQMYDLLWRAMQEYPIGGGMGLTAENVAERYGISREAQDRLALQSQQRACKAIQDGKFREEITPVIVNPKKPDKVVDTDEHPRPDLTFEKLSKLPAVFKTNGTVTAGNACGMNDAAAAMILVSERKLEELGAKPLARIIGYGVAGVDPAYMGIGPVPAIGKALERAGLTIDDIDLFEINEAFAAQYLACEKELGLNGEIVNVNGSGISLGHPVGATGCRLSVTLIHEMMRRKLKYGVASLCAGGGHGFAVVLERIQENGS